MAATRSTPLHTHFSFSYMRRGGKANAAKTGAENDPSAEGAAADTPAVPAPTPEVNPYENSIKSITSISTVEAFWTIYDYLKRPNDLTPTTDYHCFREGIKPTWEDPGNSKGGKWIIRLPKGLSSRFTGVALEEICGAVLSVRYSEDILGVWNRNAGDRDTVDRIRDAIKKILQLPPMANMEYKPHQNSLQDRSSFRNTQVWKPKTDRARTGWTDTKSERTRSGSWADSKGERSRSGSWTDRDSSNTKPRREVRGSWRNAGT